MGFFSDFVEKKFRLCKHSIQSFNRQFQAVGFCASQPIVWVIVMHICLAQTFFLARAGCFLAGDWPID
jgi:hypothetical protein